MVLIKLFEVKNRIKTQISTNGYMYGHYYKNKYTKDKKLTFLLKKCKSKVFYFQLKQTNTLKIYIPLKLDKKLPFVKISKEE